MSCLLSRMMTVSGVDSHPRWQLWLSGDAVESGQLTPGS